MFTENKLLFVRRGLIELKKRNQSYQNTIPESVVFNSIKLELTFTNINLTLRIWRYTYKGNVTREDDTMHDRPQSHDKTHTF